MLGASIPIIGVARWASAQSFCLRSRFEMIVSRGACVMSGPATSQDIPSDVLTSTHQAEHPVLRGVLEENLSNPNASTRRCELDTAEFKSALLRGNL